MVRIGRERRGGSRPRPGLLARNRLGHALLVLCLVLLGAWTGPAPRALADGHPGAPRPAARDQVTVSGFDLGSDLPSDVVVGSSGTNLDVRFVAGRPLVDGTILVALPRKAWPTALHRADQLYVGDPQLAGSFVVRPIEPLFDYGAGDCRGTGDQPITVTVAASGSAHLGIVQHLTCAPGQQTSIRVVDVSAPGRVGTYAIPVSVSDASGLRTPDRVRLRVVKRPTTRLTVDLPDQVQVLQPVLVTVRAVRPNGRPDTHDLGWVRLVGPGGDECVFESGAPVRFQLTARDAGVVAVPVYFQVTGVHQLVAESLSRRAVAGQSQPFTVLGEPPPAACSVSYH